MNGKLFYLLILAPNCKCIVQNKSWLRWKKHIKPNKEFDLPFSKHIINKWV